MYIKIEKSHESKNRRLAPHTHTHTKLSNLLFSSALDESNTHVKSSQKLKRCRVHAVCFKNGFFFFVICAKNTRVRKCKILKSSLFFLIHTYSFKRGMKRGKVFKAFFFRTLNSVHSFNVHLFYRYFK